MLSTKCILALRSNYDGLRISVMSRHTLDDGVTNDPRILPSMYSLHFTSLSPPPQLIGSYLKRGLSWEDYERRYLDHLKSPNAVSDISRIIHFLNNRLNVTLLCIEETPEHCHRRLLALEIKKGYSGLIDIQ